VTNDEMIEAAASLLEPHSTSSGRLLGNVASIVVSTGGQRFGGVCIDTWSWGICAERSAIAAMVTAGEYVVASVVAVWRDERDGQLCVLPPCGNCRDFMRQLSRENLNARVVLGRAETVQLADLLPMREPIALDGHRESG
jgi:cytidine deaminase